MSAQQRQQYERDGFLVVKGLVPRDRLRGWIDHFLDISRSASEGDGMVRGDMTVMKDVAIAKSEAVEGEAAITKLQDWQRDDKLFSYCSQPEVLKYVHCFTGPNVRSIHTMLINKPPDPGTQTSRHPLHQDLNYFPFRPANRIVCAWTAMERVHRGNGCLNATINCVQAVEYYCAGPGEPCYYDPLCFTPHLDSDWRGAGCSAGGVPGCRFCGFTDAAGFSFPACPIMVKSDYEILKHEQR